MEDIWETIYDMDKRNRTPFGYMPDGTKVERFALKGKAMACEIITYGAAVRSLVFPRRDGTTVDLVLGFDTLEDYLAQDKYMGAQVGRYANRIGGAKFSLNGVEYPLAANDGENSLHGGNAGFDKQVWRVGNQERGFRHPNEQSITFFLTSPDGQEGYPGTLDARVTYLLRDRELIIEYRAKCDRDTVFNPTSHLYFNLSGHDSGPVTDQYIQLNASRYTPVGPGLIPTGELAPVDGTPMDLRGLQPIGAHIGEPFHQLTMAGGYDHNWVIDGWNGTLQHAATAWSPETGIAMDVLTTMRGVQFYAGNFLAGCPTGKGGAVYGDRHGFCLETQFFPDSPNKPGFPSCVLRAGETFRSRTHYKFYRRKKEGIL